MLVFVEDPVPQERAWGDLPEQLLTAAGLDLDVLLYRGGAPLRSLLNDDFGNAGHLIILTRQGGLPLVQQALVDEARALDGSREPGRHLAPDVRSCFFRTRLVVTVGRGPPSTSAADLGIARQLQEALRSFHAQGLPRPASLEGPSLDAGGSEPGVLIHELAALIRRPELALASEVIARTFELDCAARINVLVEESPDHSSPDLDAPVPAIQASWPGAQGEVCRRLEELCGATSAGPIRVVVTGAAGVGKSTVLRALARRLASAHLQGFRANPLLPIVVPLSFANLDPERLRALSQADPARRAKLLHDLMFDWWLEWVGTLTYERAVDLRWLVNRLSAYPTVLILDGVDELLTNHPSLGLVDLRRLGHHLAAAYSQNSRLPVLIGVRSTQPGLVSLASDSGHVHEILRLSASQVQAQFPAATEWLGAIHDERLRQVLLTPLILARLNSRIRRLPGEHVPTRAEIINFALLTMLETSGLCALPGARGQLTDPAQWMAALTLIAWLLFYRLRGEIAVSALEAEAREAMARWERHLAEGGQSQQAAALLSGFELLCHQPTRDALIERTIIHTTHQGTIRLMHREWQDFLVSKYIADCVSAQNVDELGCIATTTLMSVTSAELLGNLPIGLDLVSRVFRRAEETGAQLIAANFLALLGNSYGPISRPALELIFQNASKMKPLPRMVTFTGFSNRVLKRLPHDPSVAGILGHLASGLRDCLEPGAGAAVDPITSSLAWCHLQAFHRLFGTEPPAVSWERLWVAPEEVPQVLAMICDTSKSPPVVTPQHRSVQMAFLLIQDLALEVPTRLISAVHYLCYIAVARYHGVHISDVGERLPAMLAAGSELAGRVQDYALVPELRKVFEHCRTMLSLARTRREARAPSGGAEERQTREASLEWSLPAAWNEKLTTREIEVVSRVLDGWDNQLISEDLGCSLGTIKKHLQHVFDKLGLSSRTMLQAVAYRRAWDIRSGPDASPSPLENN